MVGGRQDFCGGLQQSYKCEVASEFIVELNWDCRRHRLEFQSFAMQLLCSCSYREFFQQDDEYGFDETGTDQIVLNLGVSESVYSNDC